MNRIKLVHIPNLLLDGLGLVVSFIRSLHKPFLTCIASDFFQFICFTCVRSTRFFVVACTRANVLRGPNHRVDIRYELRGCMYHSVKRAQRF